MNQFKLVLIYETRRVKYFGAQIANLLKGGDDAVTAAQHGNFYSFVTVSYFMFSFFWYVSDVKKVMLT